MVGPAEVVAYDRFGRAMNALADGKVSLSRVNLLIVGGFLCPSNWHRCVPCKTTTWLDVKDVKVVRVQPGRAVGFAA